ALVTAMPFRMGRRCNTTIRARGAFPLPAAAGIELTGMTNPSDTIDRPALRRKYREERDKRLRPDGNEQYVEPRGRFAHFLDDPYVPRVTRAPRRDEVTVAFIGGGFAGLVTGARLKQAGVDDVCIIEGGGDVGGAWYWNRYPGAMCDT